MSEYDGSCEINLEPNTCGRSALAIGCDACEHFIPPKKKIPLRVNHCPCCGAFPVTVNCENCAQLTAAQETIRELKYRNVILEEALRPFADAVFEGPIYGITLDDLNKAAEVLEVK